MRNAFLVIRSIFFALLLYLNVLLLVFAVWNVAAAKSSGLSAPGATVFLVVNSVLTIVFVTGGYLGELICAKARPSHVRVECLWTASMSILQLGSSVTVTVNGPPMACQVRSTWSTCASASLLVPVSWLATLIIIAYCFTICITSVVHSDLIPDIWTTSVSSTPWFSGAATTRLPQARSRVPSKAFSTTTTSSEESCAVTKYIAERWEKLSGMERQAEPSNPILFSRGRQSVDSSRPTWARQTQARRGIDQPFGLPTTVHGGQQTNPSPPPKVLAKDMAESDPHYVEVRRKSEMNKNDSGSRSILTPRTPTAFPNRIADPDLPIPLPCLSDWIRADAARGISVDSVPLPSP
ncbi:hypothetical protein F5I97DRAFT_1843070 [Phlebopus sp. FC_14]|nr:hypothetical protein F5I97DRAFT_1843070 [Phlebopus sp. FC_14]